MTALLTACTFGTQGPTAVFTTKAVYGMYEGDLAQYTRYAMPTELGDAGFRHLALATIPVLFDDNLTSDKIYMVDLNNTWLQLLARGNFQVTAFQDSINQLAQIAKMYIFGNLTSGSLRTNGIIASVAA